MRLAIVVPTLDEEEALRKNLPAAALAADEIVVSDGGSRDRTVAIARASGVPVVSGPPGRGRQLNRGAAATTAEVLLFLHADSTLPPRAAERVREAVAAGAVAGAFRVRFDSERSAFRLGERIVDLRTRWTGLPLGDQAQFITRQAFERLGGFRNWPILEDLDLMRRLRGERVALLDERVTTSARRYLERGVARTIATNWLIWLLFSLGVPPERLAGFYKNIR